MLINNFPFTIGDTVIYFKGDGQSYLAEVKDVDWVNDLVMLDFYEIDGSPIIGSGSWYPVDSCEKVDPTDIVDSSGQPWKQTCVCDSYTMLHYNKCQCGAEAW